MAMRTTWGNAPTNQNDKATSELRSNETWLFAQAILGNPVPTRSAAEVNAIAEQEFREWLAEITTEGEGPWDAAKHPRGGFSQNRGWFSLTAGSGRSSKRMAAAQPDPSDPSRWYLPSDEKGKWVGEKGKSTFRLKTPVEVNGKLVHEVEYVKGLPVLDKFAVPGKTATIHRKVRLTRGKSPTLWRHIVLRCKRRTTCKLVALRGLILKRVQRARNNASTNG